MALLVTIVVGGVALLVVIACGFLKYRPGMTVVGCNSAALSAACQSRPDEDKDAASKPLQWGEVPGEGETGHCCFSAGAVSLPVEGKLYA